MVDVARGIVAQIAKIVVEALTAVRNVAVGLPVAVTLAVLVIVAVVVVVVVISVYCVPTNVLFWPVIHVTRTFVVVRRYEH